MEEQQKWFIPQELSQDDALGVVKQIEAYIEAHPDEAGCSTLPNSSF